MTVLPRPLSPSRLTFFIHVVNTILFAEESVIASLALELRGPVVVFVHMIEAVELAEEFPIAGLTFETLGPVT